MTPDDLLRLAREGAPLDRQRSALAEVLSAAGLSSERTEAALAHARDAVALLEQDGGGRGRLGGQALLPPGEPWPRDRDGRQLGFIAAIDLGELPGLAPLPDSGLLLVYWDFEFHDLDRMDFVESTRVWLVDDPETAVAQDPPAPEEPRQAIALTGAVMPVLGELEKVDEAIGDGEHDDEDAWYDVNHALIMLHDHQLLGSSRDVQGPVLDEVDYWFKEGFADTRERYSEAERRGEGWTLLAQIESSGDFVFGDAGALYLLIPEADLHARRFDRVMGVMQCA